MFDVLRIGKFEILNGKRTKVIAELLKEQWGYDHRFETGLLQKGDDLFLVTKDVCKVDLQKFNVNSLGAYLGEMKHGSLRLSIEGSQIVGPEAQKNVLEIDAEQLRQWLGGKDLELSDSFDCADGEKSRFVIMKHERDFLGCGRIKDGRVLNFVPKSRRTS